MPAPQLILGPLVRYVGEREATVWVEADGPCEVEVLGHAQRTFGVGGHHYALVTLGGLEPGSSHPYEVHLDGTRRWPPAGSRLPAPRIRTLNPARGVRLVYGSCRIALPHEAPFTLSQDQDERGYERDALVVLAEELLAMSEEDWPDVLLMLGDQVYVDEGSPEVREFIRARRDTSQPPGDEVADFEEYTRLYHESWSSERIRWLFSVVSTSMTIDDHDMSDDWNISRAWLEERRREHWWHERLIGGLMSYWLYQHLGNLSPHELAENEVYVRALEAGDDATEIVREHAENAAHDPEGIRWSYHRDFGDTRLIVMDSRIGRVLDEDRRSIFDEHEGEWLAEQAKGDFDHLLLATSDPVLLVPGAHYLEAWGEQICAGRWGSLAAKGAEKLRRTFDFDHWAAFTRSFALLWELIRSVAAGEHGSPPASVIVLSGDVHHAYLTEVAFPRGSGVRSRVYQAVCSPFRNPLNRRERTTIRAISSPAGTALARGLARRAGVEDPPVRWRLVEGPFFDNQVGSLRIRGRVAWAKLEKTVAGEAREHAMRTSYERRVA